MIENTDKQPSESKLYEDGHIMTDGKSAYSKCHHAPLVRISLFLGHPGAIGGVLGETWVCSYVGWENHKRVECGQPVPSKRDSPGTLWLKKPVPEGFTQSTWNEIKRRGPGYGPNGFGYYWTPTTAGNPGKTEPRLKAEDRKANAYQPPAYEPGCDADEWDMPFVPDA